MKPIWQYRFTRETLSYDTVLDGESKLWTLKSISYSYQLISLISVGGYGIIFKGKNQKTGEVFAVKVVPLNGRSEVDHLNSVRETVVTEFVSSLGISPKLITTGYLKRQQYDAFDNYIVGTVNYGYKDQPKAHNYLQPFNDSTGYMIYVSELYDIDLHSFMDKQGVLAHQTFIKLEKYITGPKIIQSLINDITLMHDNRIVHCDLKPNNIVCKLIVTETGQELIQQMKMIDFGLCMFDDYRAEPRFAEEEMVYRLRIMDYYTNQYSRYVGTRPRTEDVKLKKSKLDQWVIDSLRQSEQMYYDRMDYVPKYYEIFGMKFKSPFDEYKTPPLPERYIPTRQTPYKREAPPPGTRRAKPPPSSANEEEEFKFNVPRSPKTFPRKPATPPKQPSPPSELNWFTGQYFFTLFPALKGFSVKNLEKWYRKVGTKIHPDKYQTIMPSFEPYCEQNPECTVVTEKVLKEIYTTLLGIKAEVLNGENPQIKQSLRDISNQVLAAKIGKAVIEMLNTVAKTI